jgi:site-specific recombinase XerD
MLGKKIATSSEIKKLLKISKERATSDAAKSDYVAIVIMVGAGLRRFEVCGLKVKDIDLAANLITVEHGKGDKRREVVLTDWVKSEIKDYISSLAKTDYIFTTKRTNHKEAADNSALHRRIKTLMLMADCRDCVSAHSLRHAFATNNLRNGVSLAGVRDLLGHSSISVTSGYLHFIGEDADRAKKIKPF